MDAEQIRCVRRFNRAATRRIGVLSDSYLDRGRPLGEARLLYEIGRDGCGLAALRTGLGLDSGYLSRLLRSLERQGLVRTQRSKGDGRSRHVAPTRRGVEEFEEYDRRSNDFARSLLARLTAAQRHRLIAAMAEVERLMRAAAVEIRIERPDSPVALGCLEAYYRELADRFAGGYDPAKTLPVRPEEATPPAGCFLVAFLDGEGIGCGALRRRDAAPGDAATGEIKRMWVAASCRGLGVGRRLLRRLEEEARQFGLGVLRLDTNAALNEARSLYRSSGYREVPAFNDEPYAQHWFAKILSPAPAVD